MAVILGRKPGGSGGGGAPSGPAGGDLTGTYPNPTLAAGSVEAAALAATAATPIDGWIDDSAATWTRTANQTFTVTGDRTTVFAPGRKLRWTQTTVKYGYVLSSSHAAGTTTVTIFTTPDYVLTAAAISANSYSHILAPIGFPPSFTYVPVWSSSGTQPTIGDGSLTGRFTVEGQRVTVEIAFQRGAGSSNGTGNYAFSIPAPYVGGFSALGNGYLIDAGTAEYVGTSRAGLTTSDLTIQMNTATANGVLWGATTPFTLATNDQAQITGRYLMA